MKQINNFDELIQYLNHVGIRYHGKGCIPPTQANWVRIDKFVCKRIAYPYGIKLTRRSNVLNIHKDGKGFTVRAYD